MAKVLQMSVETMGTTKVIYHAHLQHVEVSTCKLTWFPLQQTAHIWFASPALHRKHCVTMFQKFKGSFQELVQEYMAMFQQIMWLLVPVIQGRSSLDMLPFKLKGLTPCVAALVRALVILKKSVDFEKNGDSKCSGASSSNVFCRVDDRATDPEPAHRGPPVNV